LYQISWYKKRTYYLNCLGVIVEYLSFLEVVV